MSVPRVLGLSSLIVEIYVLILFSTLGNVVNLCEPQSFFGTMKDT